MILENPFSVSKVRIAIKEGCGRRPFKKGTSCAFQSKKLSMISLIFMKFMEEEMMEGGMGGEVGFSELALDTIILLKSDYNKIYIENSYNKFDLFSSHIVTDVP